MPRVTFIEFNGVHHDVDVSEGWSLMEAALKNGVPGIDGDCGGCCACATCHVFIGTDWTDATGEPTETESHMLEFVENTTSRSRLACQIPITNELDGLLVELPSSQQ